MIMTSCSESVKKDQQNELTEKERDSLLKEKNIRLAKVNSDNFSDSTEPTIRIKFTPIVPFYPSLGEDGVKLIESRLSSIISKYTISANANDPSFVMIPSINLISGNITATAPAMFVNVYEITFYTANIEDGTIFSSETFTLRGAGTTHLRAFINAIKTINDDEIKFKKLLTNGDQKALNYYENNCNKIIQRAKIEASTRNYSASLSILKSIPSSVECYNKVGSLIVEVFNKKLFQDCSGIYNQMKAELGKQNELGGYSEKAMALYALIPLDAPCYKLAEQTYEAYIKNLDPNAKIKLQQEEWKNQLAITKLELEAKVAIEGQTALIDKYKSDHEYNKLPWLRKLVHLGAWDPFDASSKINK